MLSLSHRLRLRPRLLLASGRDGGEDGLEPDLLQRLPDLRRGMPGRRSHQPERTGFQRRRGPPGKTLLEQEEGFPMSKEMMMAGCFAAAHACKIARVEVISSYPIRPYTGIMIEPSQSI